MTTRSIFVQLKAEHDELKTILKSAKNAKGAERRRAVSKIKHNLIPHARAEEKILYALMTKLGTTEDLDSLLHEAYIEHRTADDLLKSLASEDVSSELWPAKLAVLKENVEHHIREEENHFFPKAKKYISRSLSFELLAAYLHEKAHYSESLPTQDQIHSRSLPADLRREV